MCRWRLASSSSLLMRRLSRTVISPTSVPEPDSALVEVLAACFSSDLPGLALVQNLLAPLRLYGECPPRGGTGCFGLFARAFGPAASIRIFQQLDLFVRFFWPQYFVDFLDLLQELVRVSPRCIEEVLGELSLREVVGIIRILHSMPASSTKCSREPRQDMKSLSSGLRIVQCHFVSRAHGQVKNVMQGYAACW